MGTDSSRAAEAREAYRRYVTERGRAERGEIPWSAVAEGFFTEDAVFIDPAWGRVEGIEEMKRTVFGEAMVGLEDWKFPTEFYAISGNDVVIKWQQVLPGKRDDGRPFAQSGYSTLIYAGDGKFCYEEDLLNMTHFFEDMRESGWTPPPGMGMPPKHPNRDFSRPRRTSS